jgi:hypothetical protein
MAFIQKIINQLSSKQELTLNNSTSAADQLSEQELIFLLSIIKDATFRGEYIEAAYTTVAKLQNQYLQQTKE